MFSSFFLGGGGVVAHGNWCRPFGNEFRLCYQFSALMLTLRKKQPLSETWCGEKGPVCGGCWHIGIYRWSMINNFRFRDGRETFFFSFWPVVFLSRDSLPKDSRRLSSRRQCHKLPNRSDSLWVEGISYSVSSQDSALLWHSVPSDHVSPH